MFHGYNFLFISTIPFAGTNSHHSILVFLWQFRSLFQNNLQQGFSCMYKWYQEWLTTRLEGNSFKSYNLSIFFWACSHMWTPLMGKDNGWGYTKKSLDPSLLEWWNFNPSSNRGTVVAHSACLYSCDPGSHSAATIADHIPFLSVEISPSCFWCYYACDFFLK
jgi:hypothetical protein